MGRERSGRGSARTVCAVLYSAVAKACGREACLVFRVLKSVNERNIDAWPRGRRRSSAGDQALPRVAMSRQTTLGLYRSPAARPAASPTTTFASTPCAACATASEQTWRRDSEAIDLALHEGRRQLEVVKRQSVVSQMFPQDKHAMESRSR